jgi:RNA polymerase primary sigma factor
MSDVSNGPSAAGRRGLVPLGRNDEVALAKRIAGGNLESKRQLIEASLGLVRFIARRYRGRGLDYEDLVQEGTFGLIRAIDGFDPGRGYRFSTYASWWIRQAIQCAVRDRGRAIRLPAPAAEKLRTIEQAERRLTGSLGRAPRGDELAASAGMSPKNVAALRAVAERPSSLEAGRQGTGAEAERGGGDVDQDLERALSRDLTLRTLKDALATLPDLRQRQVLELHYGLGGREPKTLKQIGAQLGLTAPRISQLEHSALAALRSTPAAAEWREAAAA